MLSGFSCPGDKWRCSVVSISRGHLNEHNGICGCQSQAETGLRASQRVQLPQPALPPDLVGHSRPRLLPQISGLSPYCLLLET